MDRPTISPLPPLALSVGLPWDVAVADPVAALAEARRRLGDTFVVDSGEDRYLFTFSPVGVASFYELPEERASKGVADWRMLRRKLPDEIFVGRRTLPHQLFGRDDVASYLANVHRALDAAVDELGAGRHLRRVRPHPPPRATGSAWRRGEAPGRPEGERFERLVSGVRHPRRVGVLRPPRRHGGGGGVGEGRAERGALAVIVDGARPGPGRSCPASSPTTRCSPGWPRRGRTRPADEGAARGVALDVALVHVASMSNLFAALGWMLIDLLGHPDELARVRAGDRARAEVCALESTRLAQRSIMARYVLAP